MAGLLDVQHRELTDGEQPEGRHERLDQLARAVWRSSSLNATKDAYVVQPPDTMRDLGRFLDRQEP